MYKQAEKIIYSPSDLTLFMESPFASWMERLTLHHPDFAGNADDDKHYPLTNQEITKSRY